MNYFLLNITFTFVKFFKKYFVTEFHQVKIVSQNLEDIYYKFGKIEIDIFIYGSIENFKLYNFAMDHFSKCCLFQEIEAVFSCPLRWNPP